MKASIEKEKLEIINWITSLKDESTIERLSIMRNNPISDDWWNEISEAEKATIDKGLDDLKAGRVQSHAQVKKRYENWL